MAWTEVSISDWIEALVVSPCDVVLVSIRSFSIIRNARERRDDGAGPSRVYFSNLCALAGSKLGKDK